MGTIPDLDGNIFLGNSGSAVMGTIPEVDGKNLPEHLVIDAHDCGTSPSLGFSS
jgi:hypothetical protein